MKRKDEILEIAGQLFAEKGYDLSMSDIAGKIGIKTPSLYSHFESKDEIISLVLEREVIKMYDFFNMTLDRLQEEGTEQKLKRLFFSIFDYFEKPGQLEILRRIPFVENEMIKMKLTKVMLERDASFSLKVREIIEEGILSGEVRENAEEGTMLLYLAMIQGMLDTKLLQKYTDSRLQDYTLTAWEAFWNGIKAGK
jgi:AcrR family transcriptional regulator